MAASPPLTGLGGDVLARIAAAVGPAESGKLRELCRDTCQMLDESRMSLQISVCQLQQVQFLEACGGGSKPANQHPSSVLRALARWPNLQSVRAFGSASAAWVPHLVAAAAAADALHGGGTRPFQQLVRGLVLQRLCWRGGAALASDGSPKRVFAAASLQACRVQYVLEAVVLAGLPAAEAVQLLRVIVAEPAFDVGADAGARFKQAFLLWLSTHMAYRGHYEEALEVAGLTGDEAFGMRGRYTVALVQLARGEWEAAAATVTGAPAWRHVAGYAGNVATVLSSASVPQPQGLLLAARVHDYVQRAAPPLADGDNEAPQPLPDWAGVGRQGVVFQPQGDDAALFEEMAGVIGRLACGQPLEAMQRLLAGLTLRPQLCRLLRSQVLPCLGLHLFSAGPAHSALQHVDDLLALCADEARRLTAAAADTASDDAAAAVVERALAAVEDCTSVLLRVRASGGAPTAEALRRHGRPDDPEVLGQPASARFAAHLCSLLGADVDLSHRSIAGFDAAAMAAAPSPGAPPAYHALPGSLHLLARLLPASAGGCDAFGAVALMASTVSTGAVSPSAGDAAAAMWVRVLSLYTAAAAELERSDDPCQAAVCTLAAFGQHGAAMALARAVAGAERPGYAAQLAMEVRGARGCQPACSDFTCSCSLHATGSVFSHAWLWAIGTLRDGAFPWPRDVAAFSLPHGCKHATRTGMQQQVANTSVPGVRYRTAQSSRECVRGRGRVTGRAVPQPPSLPEPARRPTCAAVQPPPRATTTPGRPWRRRHAAGAHVASDTWTPQSRGPRPLRPTRPSWQRGLPPLEHLHPCRLCTLLLPPCRRRRHAAPGARGSSRTQDHQQQATRIPAPAPAATLRVAAAAAASWTAIPRRT